MSRFRTALCSLTLVLTGLEPARSQDAAEGQSVDIGIGYTVDAITNVRGGNDRGTAVLDNLDLTIAVDLHRTIGLTNALFYIYGLGNQGQQPSALSGDIQGVDNIETVNAWRIYEAFVQYRLPGDRLSILAGLYDVNTEFDEMESAQLFLNSSFGIGAELALSRSQGPSTFPFTSLGARVRVVPGNGWYAQLAVMDGVPGHPGNPRAGPFHFDTNDGLLLMSEAGRVFGESPLRNSTLEEQERWRRRRVSRTGAISYRSKIAIGAWRYTAHFDRLDSASRQRGNTGVYALGQRCLYDVNGRRVSGFIRVGLADNRVNQVAGYTGGGLTVTGFVAGRPEDRIGLGIAIAHHAPSYRERQDLLGSPVPGRETTLEGTYRASILPWLSLQGNVQYVSEPGTDSALGNALVLGLRLHVEG